MRYFIGNYEIRRICAWHGIQYGKQKAPKRPNVEAGICDICEAVSEQKGAPQSVLPVADYQGLMVQDSGGIITTKTK